MKCKILTIISFNTFSAYLNILIFIIQTKDTLNYDNRNTDKKDQTIYCSESQKVFNTLLKTCVSCAYYNKIWSNNINDCINCTDPLLYSTNLNKCVLNCEINEYANYADRICQNQSLYRNDYDLNKSKKQLQACASGETADVNGNCISCFNANLYDSGGNCISLPCPANTFRDDTTKFCIDYIAQGKYLYNNQLVSVCPDGYSDDSNTNNICQSCYSQGLYNYEGTCYATCPTTPGIYVKVSELQCIDYKSQGLYFYNNSLYSKCPATTWSDSNNNCIDCFSAGVYKYKNICYQTCPTDTFIIVSSLTCIECNSGTYFHIDTCLESCPNFFVPNDDTQTCVSCSEYKYITFCVASCPAYSYLDTSIKQCFLCTDTNQLYYNGECVDTCPEGYYKSVEGSSCDKGTVCFPDHCLNNSKCEEKDFVTTTNSDGTTSSSATSFTCNCLEDNYGNLCENSGLVNKLKDIWNKIYSIIDNSGFKDTIEYDQALQLKYILEDLQNINELVSDKLTDTIFLFISK